MAAHGNLSPRQFGDYSIEYAGHEKNPGGRVGYHQVVTKDATGEQVGKMLWRTRTPTPGELERIDVAKDHRRKGLATAMWNYAADTGIRPSPKHSRMRTDDGDAWAKSTGDRVPRRVSGRV